MPDEPEVHGLLALMLCHDAPPPRGSRATRSSASPTRTARSGTRGQIAAGRAALDRARAARPRPVRAAGRDRLARRPSPRSTGRRSRRSTTSSRALTGSPVVELNRAVARGRGRRRRRRRSRIVDAARRSTTTATCTRRAAELLRRLGRDAEARAAYERALALAPPDAGAAVPRAPAERPGLRARCQTRAVPSHRKSRGRAARALAVAALLLAVAAPPARARRGPDRAFTFSAAPARRRVCANGWSGSLLARGLPGRAGDLRYLRIGYGTSSAAPHVGEMVVARDRRRRRPPASRALACALPDPPCAWSTTTAPATPPRLRRQHVGVQLPAV